MAHVKRICTRFLHAAELRRAIAHPLPAKGSTMGPVSGTTPVLLLPCSSCLFRVLPRGQTARPSREPLGIKHTLPT